MKYDYGDFVVVKKPCDRINPTEDHKKYMLKRGFVVKRDEKNKLYMLSISTDIWWPESLLGFANFGVGDVVRIINLNRVECRAVERVEKCTRSYLSKFHVGATPTSYELSFGRFEVLCRDVACCNPFEESYVLIVKSLNTGNIYVINEDGVKISSAYQGGHKYIPTQTVQKVADIFGVEVGERFDVCILGNQHPCCESPFLFDPDRGLINSSGDTDSIVFRYLITGKAIPKKLCRYVADGEIYWYVGADGDVEKSIMKSDDVDMARMLVGNFFPTIFEANTSVDTILKRFDKVERNMKENYSW